MSFPARQRHTRLRTHDEATQELARWIAVTPVESRACAGQLLVSSDVLYASSVGVGRPEWLLTAGSAPLPERAPRAFAAYLRAVRATTSFDLGRVEASRRALGDRSAIIAILHQESLLHFICPYDRAITLLVGDRDSDGMYVRLARAFGYRTVEAAPWSSLRCAREVLAEPRAVLVAAVDGPAGPAGLAKVGIAKLAQLAGIPLVPLRCWSSRAVRLRTTWDARLVPLPWSVVTVAAGFHLELSRDAPREEVVAVARLLGHALADPSGGPPRR